MKGGRMKVTGFVLALAVALIASTSASAAVVHPPRVKGITHGTSHNWSGYAVSGQTFSDVTGSWTQPTATCTATNKSGHAHPGGPGYAGFWVGLDGNTSDTVEQVGTEADCSGGTAINYAWYELYPAATVVLNPADYPVVAGDSLTGEVDATDGTITLADTTQDWTYQLSDVDFGSDARSSAEWIAEAPYRGRILPLTNFGSVAFSNATADGHPIDNYSNEPITMLDRKNNTIAVPSALGSGGDNFTITRVTS